jgi:hypothetical protein
MSRVFYHANFDCIRGMHDEIRAADNIDGLSERSDPERRVITALRSVTMTTRDERTDGASEAFRVATSG